MEDELCIKIFSASTPPPPPPTPCKRDKQQCICMIQIHFFACQDFFFISLAPPTFNMLPTPLHIHEIRHHYLTKLKKLLCHIKCEIHIYIMTKSPSYKQITEIFVHVCFVTCTLKVYKIWKTPSCMSHFLY